MQGDSELIVRQLIGRYKASEKGGLIQPLAESKALLSSFAEHHVKHVLRSVLWVSLLYGVSDAGWATALFLLLPFIRCASTFIVTQDFDLHERV